MFMEFTFKIITKTTLLLSLTLFFSLYALSTTQHPLDTTPRPFAGKVQFYFQIMKKTGEKLSGGGGGARRMLGGPGSSPPRCTSKCGRCTPCKPVHVPVPPGTPVTAEYYPEAWRCKCGNKLYMP
ncbi:PREDICTED: EPIDERMAL PATTERNING FACTOR-like protein 4 isoform X2 [Ipomoea nil]|uniref:EPIDERMAL PATTERNING FACTOR-like protein 4 isoform X2 n=1 Tax=Ipomoea nil TaxID=35883 RepID=UPI000901DDF8|nr:PREDICTED: EPIDERMAL PATTERNING FACTOR-like protein 4 isoform X2 [Ipomoea nil]